MSTMVSGEIKYLKERRDRLCSEISKLRAENTCLRKTNKEMKELRRILAEVYDLDGVELWIQQDLEAALERAAQLRDGTFA